MYKIYVNGTRLILCSTQAADKLYAKSDQVMVARYPGHSRYLLNYIDMMEKSPRWSHVVIHSENYEDMIKDWNKICPTIKAAGGLVVNPDCEILFIHRRGHWDLPKGKMEKGETKKQTAIREVMEETGAVDLEIQDKLVTTKHLYRGKSGKRFVKKSYWYLMTGPHQILEAQTEEDIEEARWMTLSDWDKETIPTYDNIRLVIHDAKQVMPELR